MLDDISRDLLNYNHKDNKSDCQEMFEVDWSLIEFALDAIDRTKDRRLKTQLPWVKEISHLLGKILIWLKES